MTATLKYKLEKIARVARHKARPPVPAALARTAAVRIENAEAAAVPASARATPLGALLAGHVLQDGEVVLLLLKPSPLYILLSTLRWAAVIAILLVFAKIYDQPLPGPNSSYVMAGLFVYAGRLMWAVLQWMGRLYILTDLRILRLQGVFSIDLFDCPLRKVLRTRLTYTARERLFGLGSIEITPIDDNCPIAQWQTIARPAQVHEQVAAAINRAKQGGFGGAGNGHCHPTSRG
jgi:hypothetical protein